MTHICTVGHTFYDYDTVWCSTVPVSSCVNRKI